MDSFLFSLISSLFLRLEKEKHASMSFLTLQPSPTTFDEVFQCIFDYIDRLFVMVRPRKLLYMAIGG